MQNRKVVVSGMACYTEVGDTLDQLLDAVLYKKNTKKYFIKNELFNGSLTVKSKMHIQNKIGQIIESAFSMAELPSVSKLSNRRIGIVLGTFLGELGILCIDNNAKLKPSEINLADITSGVSHLLKTDNINFTILNSCAAGSSAIGLGYELIRCNLLDIAVVGGYEFCGDFTYAGMKSVKALGDIIRPFDINRNGTVIGSGIGILILEDEKSALLREHKIWAEIGGFGTTNDAFHLLRPDPYGEGLSRAIHIALQDLEINKYEIDYINAHGTGTKLNDIAETRAIKHVFGKDAIEIPISSTKPITYHTLGASGAIEAIITILSMEVSMIPQTFNYSLIDGECDLDYVKDKYRNKQINIAISNSIGFGGYNACLIIKKYKKNNTPGYLQNINYNQMYEINHNVKETRHKKKLEYNLISDFCIDTFQEGIKKNIFNSDMCIADQETGFLLNMSGFYNDQIEKFHSDIINKGARLASPANFTYGFPGAAVGIIDKYLKFKSSSITFIDNNNSKDINEILARCILRKEKIKKIYTAQMKKVNNSYKIQMREFSKQIN